MSDPNEVSDESIDIDFIGKTVGLGAITSHETKKKLVDEVRKLTTHYQASKTEWVSESVDKLFNRLQIEAMQYQEIRASTQDGDLACICATHEMDIYKLLDEVKPLKRVDCEGVGDNDGFFELSTPPKREE